MRRTEIPAFGLLQGVRAVSTGVIVAGPLAAGIFAEFGADVVQLESARNPDLLRKQRSTFGLQHRNRRLMTLDIPNPHGREAFLWLLAEADVWIESSKRGTYTRWGLDDDTVRERNPRLVIVHVSGFGQTGIEETVRRTGSTRSRRPTRGS